MAHKRPRQLKFEEQGVEDTKKAKSGEKIRVFVDGW